MTVLLLFSFFLFDSRQPGMDVMNGIAYREESGEFYVTGKMWPVTFALEITAGKCA